MLTDKVTREAIRAFEEKMRTEGADGFAAGPHPWEDWDVSGNAKSDDRIWDNSALHEGARKRARPGPGERLLNGLAMLAMLALLVGIGGVYFSEEPEQTIAQRGVQPLPIIRKPSAVPASEAPHRPSVRPVPTPGEVQNMPATVAGTPESAAELAPAPAMAVPAPAGSPVPPVPESPPGAQAGADIAMADVGKPAVTGALSSALSTAPAEGTDSAEAEVPPAPEATPAPPAAAGMPLSTASGLLDEVPEPAEPEAPPAPEATPAPPAAAGMPLSTASGLLDEAPEPAEPEAPPAPEAAPAPPAPGPASTAAPAAEQATAAVTQAAPPAVATASPPVEGAVQPPALPAATPAPDGIVSGSPSGAKTVAADNDASPKPAPAVPEPATPERQPAGTQNPDVAALMPADKSGNWAVNLVSYTHKSAARRILGVYHEQGIDAEIQTVILNDRPMYRVRIVGYASRSAAQAQIDPLQKLLDLDSVWISRK